MSASEEANAGNRTVKTANLLLPPQEEEPSRVIQQGSLTFDPSPPTKEAKDIQLLAANNQAKFMQWHYRLSHLSVNYPSIQLDTCMYPSSQSPLPGYYNLPFYSY
jgi:hypothetical protein